MNPFALSGKAYDFCKRLVQVILPALGSFYFGLAELWNLPHADKVTGTILLVTTFLGICLGISHAQYYNGGAAYDGKMVTSLADGKTTYSLEVDVPIDDIPTKDALTLKVVPPTKTLVETEEPPV